MRSRPVAILVCAMTVLCPAFCAGELAAHAQEQGDGNRAVGPAQAQHAPDFGNRPHHQHDSDGDPQPHTAHFCLCTTGSCLSTAVNVPSLEPAGRIDADHLLLATLERDSREGPSAVHPPDDLASPSWPVPLLI